MEDDITAKPVAEKQLAATTTKSGSIFEVNVGNFNCQRINQTFEFFERILFFKTQAADFLKPKVKQKVKLSWSYNKITTDARLERWRQYITSARVTPGQNREGKLLIR